MLDGEAFFYLIGYSQARINQQILTNQYKYKLWERAPIFDNKKNVCYFYAVSHKKKNGYLKANNFQQVILDFHKPSKWNGL